MNNPPTGSKHVDIVNSFRVEIRNIQDGFDCIYLPSRNNRCNVRRILKCAKLFLRLKRGAGVEFRLDDITEQSRILQIRNIVQIG